MYNIVLVSGVQQSDSVINLSIYLSGLFQTLFPYRFISFWDRGCALNDVLLAVYTIQIYMNKGSSGSWVITAPYKIKKEGYLLRSCDPWWD